MPTITHCTEMLVHHFMRACVLLCHEYANPHCAQLWDQYRGIYDFEDRDLKQLDAIVEILNEEPTIGIGLGNGSSSSSSSQGLAVGGSTELPATPPSMESLDTTVEFRDVAFRRSTWPMKQVSSCGCVGGWVGWLVGSFVRSFVCLSAAGRCTMWAASALPSFGFLPACELPDRCMPHSLYFICARARACVCASTGTGRRGFRSPSALAVL